MRSSVSRGSVFGLVVVLALSTSAFRWPWDNPWPSSSEDSVQALDHPSLAERSAQIGDPSDGYRFAAYGDQRALADGEWQDLVRAVAAVDEQTPLHFILDTGDIVENGYYSDQFGMLAEILSPVRHLPYLVAIGNHEVHNNRERIARTHTVQFLDDLDPKFHEDRMYYRRDIGAVTFLFLDSNDFAYGVDGSGDPSATDGLGYPKMTEVPTSGRIAAQWSWLRAQLAEIDPERSVIVSFHHPFLQTSKKHRPYARALWSLSDGESTLPELLIENGVDVVVVGHTHTYERFSLRRDGREMRLVNLSGRPRDAFLWFGSGSRAAREIEGGGTEWFAERDWDVAGWEIEQTATMVDDEANQFAIFDVSAEGSVHLRVGFVPKDVDEDNVLSEIEWRDETQLIP